jgi:RecJ-like exonuclease
MFLEEIERTANVFKSIVREKFVRVFSHLDCDGICAAAIIFKVLLRLKANFSITFLKQLRKDWVEKLEIKPNEVYVFLDFGSGQLDYLDKIFEKTQLFIIDHHFPKEVKHFNLFHLNPLLFKEEGFCASVLSYWFAKFLDRKNVDLIEAALIGAIGDVMEEGWKLKGEIEEMVKEAEELGKIKVTKGIRIYGKNKPLHIALAQTYDPFIPGVTGSESNAVQFLAEAGIELSKDGRIRTLKELSLEEQKNLATAIILERLKNNLENSEDIFGNVYILKNFPSQLNDAREIATILNGCARLEKPNLGVLFLNKNFDLIDELLNVCEDYKQILRESLIKVKESLVEEGYFAYFINHEIKDTVLGTLTSILLNSLGKKLILGLTLSDGQIKISGRTNTNINLKELIVNTLEEMRCGEGGGHAKAAGAYIPIGKEKEFVEKFKVKYYEKAKG